MRCQDVNNLATFYHTPVKCWCVLYARLQFRGAALLLVVWNVGRHCTLEQWGNIFHVGELWFNSHIYFFSYDWLSNWIPTDSSLVFILYMYLFMFYKGFNLSLAIQQWWQSYRINTKLVYSCKKVICFLVSDWYLVSDDTSSSGIGKEKMVSEYLK